MVLVLRYDPESYKLCEYYASQSKEAIGMDATGPFSWKFRRNLPDIKALKHQQLYWPVWEEVLVGSIEAEGLRDNDNDMNTVME